MCCERKSWELADWWSDHQMLCWHSVIPLGFRMLSAWLLNQIIAQSPFLKSNRGIFLFLLVVKYILYLQQAQTTSSKDSVIDGALWKCCCKFSSKWSKHFCASLSRSGHPAPSQWSRFHETYSNSNFEEYPFPNCPNSKPLAQITTLKSEPDDTFLSNLSPISSVHS